MRRSVLAILLLTTAGTGVAGEWPADVKADLAKTREIYVQSTRKDGTLGMRSTVWFLYRGDAIYVASPASSWRVRRIRAGRPDAKLWIGEPNGASFSAVGQIVEKPDATLPVLYETYAEKYKARWDGEVGWEDLEPRYRSGFGDGSRVLIKYAPK